MESYVPWYRSLPFPPIIFLRATACLINSLRRERISIVQRNIDKSTTDDRVLGFRSPLLLLVAFIIRMLNERAPASEQRLNIKMSTRETKRLLNNKIVFIAVLVAPWFLVPH